MRALLAVMSWVIGAISFSVVVAGVIVHVMNGGGI